MMGVDGALSFPFPPYCCTLLQPLATFVRTEQLDDWRGKGGSKLEGEALKLKGDEGGQSMGLFSMASVQIDEWIAGLGLMSENVCHCQHWPEYLYAHCSFAVLVTMVRCAT
jgi:hypothetical protein